MVHLHFCLLSKENSFLQHSFILKFPKVEIMIIPEIKPLLHYQRSLLTHNQASTIFLLFLVLPPIRFNLVPNQRRASFSFKVVETISWTRPTEMIWGGLFLHTNFSCHDSAVINDGTMIPVYYMVNIAWFLNIVLWPYQV